MTALSIARRFSHVYRAQGLGGLAVAVLRKITHPTAKVFELARPHVTDAAGFEIGGPSPMFDRGGLLPVYPLAARIDNCNFAARTLWEADAGDGTPFRFASDKAPGRQWTAEATRLAGIPDASYDFVLSSHALEHTANPIKALKEWRRILRPGGMLVLVLPHRDGTFDHRRPVTTLVHLVEDYAAERGEDDLTHLPEVIALHDLARDPDASAEEFGDRMQRNHELRSMHHHVFDTALAVRVTEHAGFRVVDAEAMLPHHIVVIGEKCDGPVRPWAGPIRSPFRSDRAPAARS